MEGPAGAWLNNFRGSKGEEWEREKVVTIFRVHQKHNGYMFNFSPQPDRLPNFLYKFDPLSPVNISSFQRQTTWKRPARPLMKKLPPPPPPRPNTCLSVWMAARVVPFMGKGNNKSRAVYWPDKSSLLVDWANQWPQKKITSRIPY